ncbi:MAG: hypothetical protein K0U54_07695 [Bacteroidetes bacterium]|nr:hypothetical protein [Bacteroidota bacterium]
MIKKIYLIVWVLIGFTMHGQEKWKLKKNAKGIQIYTRSLDNSKFKEYKAITSLDVKMESVLDELLAAPDYIEDCKAGVSYYVSAYSENQHVFYARKDLPWPLQDRDIVTLLTVERISDKKIKLHIESLPEGIPARGKSIRIKELMGFWLLNETDGVTHITQQLHLNPEGSLPPAIVNSLLVKGPFKTFMELQHATRNKTSIGS